MSTTNSIDILLATCNGALFIREQLDSIVSQTYQNFRVIVHDDHSNDGTVSVVNEYCINYPEKFILIDDDLMCGSAKDNFAHLLGFVNADYIAFSDQDDIWTDDHISSLMSVMLAEEKTESEPLVVFSDLKVVDENLSLISDSLFKYQRLNPNLVKNYRNLLCNNVVTGCAMIFNRAALRISMPIPKCAAMHDWWIALNASKSGRCIFYPKATVYYRQHNSNVLGAKKFGVSYVFSKLNPLQMIRNYQMIQEMARFLDGRNFSPVSFFLLKIRIFFGKLIFPKDCGK